MGTSIKKTLEWSDSFPFSLGGYKVCTARDLYLLVLVMCVLGGSDQVLPWDGRVE